MQFRAPIVWQTFKTDLRMWHQFFCWGLQKGPKICRMMDNNLFFTLCIITHFSLIFFLTIRLFFIGKSFWPKVKYWLIIKPPNTNSWIKFFIGPVWAFFNPLDTYYQAQIFWITLELKLTPKNYVLYILNSKQI